MKIFLDANILVAVLNKEYPTFTYAARILSLADLPRYKLFTSPVCLAIAFYFSEKKSGTKMAKEKIKILCEKLEITISDKAVVMNALNNKKIEDFEDGIEYYSALNGKCSYIITEDKNDFHFSEIEVMSSEEFILTLN
jgi:predicted nucleic acid-binding protein